MIAPEGQIRLQAGQPGLQLSGLVTVTAPFSLVS
jgi:hypothetical protein